MNSSNPSSSSYLPPKPKHPFPFPLSSPFHNKIVLIPLYPASKSFSSHSSTSYSNSASCPYISTTISHECLPVTTHPNPTTHCPPSFTTPNAAAVLKPPVSLTAINSAAPIVTLPDITIISAAPLATTSFVTVTTTPAPHLLFSVAGSDNQLAEFHDAAIEQHAAPSNANDDANASKTVDVSHDAVIASDTLDNIHGSDPLDAVHASDTLDAVVAYDTLDTTLASNKLDTVIASDTLNAALASGALDAVTAADALDTALNATTNRSMALKVCGGGGEGGEGENFGCDIAHLEIGDTWSITSSTGEYIYLLC